MKCPYCGEEFVVRKGLAMCRSNDHDTSIEAALSLDPNKLRGRVLAFMETKPEGVTDEQIRDHFGDEFSEASARKRRTELVELGQVRYSGRKAVNARGNKMKIWECVPPTDLFAKKGPQ